MWDMTNFSHVVEIIHTTRGKERQEVTFSLVKQPPIVGMHIDGSGWMATSSSITPLGLDWMEVITRNFGNNRAIDK